MKRMLSTILLAFILSISVTAMAGFPPTATKATGESSYFTTFNMDWAGIPLTRSGTTATVGTIPIVQGGTGSTVQNFVDLTTTQTIAGAKNFTSTLTAATPNLSGAVLYSPTITSAVLGTPASGVATNLTGLPLSTGVTGTLPVSNGGTGAASLSANYILLGNGTSAVKGVPVGTSGHILVSNGTTWMASPNTSSATTITASAHVSNTCVVSNEVNDPINGNCVQASNVCTCTLTTSKFPTSVNYGISASANSDNVCFYITTKTGVTSFVTTQKDCSGNGSSTVADFDIVMIGI